MVIPRHLIALDLDGTLLNRQKKIGKKTLAYLKELKANHVIVLATGRPYRSFIHYYKQLELNTPMVCYNGAFVTNPEDPQFETKSFSFPQGVVKAIEQDLGPTVIDNIMCETNKEIWLLKAESNLASFFWHDNMHIIYGPLSKTLNQDPMTMIIKVKKRNPNMDKKVFQAVKKHPGLLVRFWGDSNFCEIYYSHISKGSALLNLLNHYDINKQYFLSFGDAENDKEMLQYAAHGYVMKHADKSMRKFGNHVTTKDHHEDGIRYELIRYFNEFKTQQANKDE
jgi:5-amino-6-(5-phospho-D-ribitylamino)uracil phosphatase